MKAISKELLSEVFGEEVTTDISVDFYEIDGVIQEWKVVWFNFKTYPLDFVVYKCKEWAFDKGYSIVTTPHSIELVFNDNKKHLRVGGHYLRYRSTADIKAITEPEAVFKACDYILKEK